MVKKKLPPPQTPPHMDPVLRFRNLSPPEGMDFAHLVSIAETLKLNEAGQERLWLRLCSIRRHTRVDNHKGAVPEKHKVEATLLDIANAAKRVSALKDKHKTKFTYSLRRLKAVAAQIKQIMDNAENGSFPRLRQIVTPPVKPNELRLQLLEVVNNWFEQAETVAELFELTKTNSGVDSVLGSVYYDTRYSIDHVTNVLLPQLYLEIAPSIKPPGAVTDWFVVEARMAMGLPEITYDTARQGRKQIKKRTR